MAWPFTSVGAPNKDSGFTTIPSVYTAPPNYDTVTQFWILGFLFGNSSDADAFIDLLDGSSNPILPTIKVPAHSPLPIPVEFMPTVGLQWRVSGLPAGQTVTGKVWGYA